MGTITSLVNLVTASTGTSSVKQPSPAAESSQNGDSAFGALFTMSVSVGTLSVAATGQIVAEFPIEDTASFSATYTSIANAASSNSAFEQMLAGMNGFINGSNGYTSSGSGSGSSSASDLSNIMQYLEKELQDEMNQQVKEGANVATAPSTMSATLQMLDITNT